jgi:hypothetical protein
LASYVEVRPYVDASTGTKDFSKPEIVAVGLKNNPKLVKINVYQAPQKVGYDSLKSTDKENLFVKDEFASRVFTAKDLKTIFGMRLVDDDSVQFYTNYKLGDDEKGGEKWQLGFYKIVTKKDLTKDQLLALKNANQLGVETEQVRVCPKDVSLTQVNPKDCFIVAQYSFDVGFKELSPMQDPTTGNYDWTKVEGQITIEMLYNKMH